MPGIRGKCALRLGVMAAAVILVASACGSGDSDDSGGSSTKARPTAPAPKGTPIVIGSVGHYSGFAGATSKASADAVSAWAQWTNDKGGINGHPVKVVVKDDQADPSKALAAVKSMVEQDKVIALVGSHEAGLEAVWEKYTTGKGIPVVGGSSNSAAYETDPLFFPTAQTAANYVALWANAAKLAGRHQVGAIACAEVPACQSMFSLVKRAAPAVGVTFASGLAVSASAPSYTSQCLSLRAKGVDAVITGTAQEVTTRFISDCAKQGYKPLFVIPGQSYKPDVAKNPAHEGAYLANDSFNWFSDDPAAKEFRDTMSIYSPNSPLNASATAGWAAAVMFGKALATATSAAPTSADVVKGLLARPAEDTLNGMIPPTTYREGKPATVAPCGWYAQIKGGKLTAPHGNKAICLG
ncbi:ABC transporter substrate-binding protein [Streptomyces sp. NPDC056660]|uniref:ABC transporter substrate-binding protein n=1 Tax=Streptomyces sp. NPDC056660 TaxID=3345897 RepID=UPI0036B6E8CA